MSTKQITVLVIVLGILVGLFLVKNTSKEPVTIEGRMSLENMVPSGFLTSDVTKVEIYSGGKDDEKVVLTKNGDDWKVESMFNASARKDVVTEFLGKMEKLKGEFRSDSADVLGDYKLKDEEALHLALFVKNEKTPSYHLLSGKSEGYANSFVRRTGENAVYTVAEDLSRQVGLWGEDDAVPDGAKWLDKTVVRIEKDKVNYLSLKTPDRSLTLEKKEKVKEPEEGEAEPPEEAKDEKKEDEKKEYEWVVTEGDPGLKYLKGSINKILNALNPFNSSDVVNPDRMEELGLASPKFRLEVRTEDGTTTALAASRAKPGEDGHIMLEGGKAIYKVSDRSFGSIFRQGGDLFEIKGLAEQAHEVESISITYPSVKIDMRKYVKGDVEEWKLASPQTGLDFKMSAPRNIVEKLVGWTPTDFADGTDLAEYGLKKPERRIRFSLKDGKSHTILLGDEARSIKGRYALLDDDKRVWIAADSDLNNIMPEISYYFDIKVFDINSDDAKSIRIAEGDASFVLTREKDVWTVDAEGDLDTDKVTKLVDRIFSASISDVSFEDRALLKNPTATLTVSTGKKKQCTLEFGGVKEDYTALRVKGIKPVLMMATTRAEELTPPLSDLLKTPEPPSAEEAKE